MGGGRRKEQRTNRNGQLSVLIGTAYHQGYVEAKQADRIGEKERALHFRFMCRMWERKKRNKLFTVDAWTVIN